MSPSWKNSFIILVLFFVILFAPLRIDIQAHPGWGIVVGKNGQVYFGDVIQNKIWKITKEAKLTKIATGIHSHQLFLDTDENLYGEHLRYIPSGNLWEISLWKISPNGNLENILPPTTNPPKGMGTVRDAHGNRYSLDRNQVKEQEVLLLQRTPEGHINIITIAEGGMLTGVVAMTSGPDNSLYVTDKSCVRKVTKDGIISTLGGDPLAGIKRNEPSRLLGLAVDLSGIVYVADYKYRSVHKITSNGVHKIMSDGFFWSPSGVTVVGEDIYILEHQTESPIGVLGALAVGPYIRVRKITSGGEIKTLATVWGQRTGVAFGVLLVIITLLILIIAKRFYWQKTAQKMVIF